MNGITANVNGWEFHWYSYAQTAEEAEQEAAGYYAMIYSCKSALEFHFSDATKAKYDTWLAHINVKQSGYIGKYGIWQYSWKGGIPGISGDVDLDYAYQDYPAIIKKAGLNGFHAGETPPESAEGNASDSSREVSGEHSNTLEQILEHVTSIDEKLK